MLRDRQTPKQTRTRFGISLGVTIAGAIILLLAALVRPAVADGQASTEGTFLGKTLANAVPACVNYLKESGVTEANFANSGIAAILTQNANENRIIKLPNEVGNTLEEPAATCWELFLGANRRGDGGTMPSLFDLYGKTPTSLTDFGYVAVNKNPTTDQGCLAVKYTKLGEDGRVTEHTTNSVCFELVDGKISTDNLGEAVIVNTDGDGGPVTLGMTYSGLGSEEGVSVTIAGADALWGGSTTVSSPRGMDWAAYLELFRQYMDGTVLGYKPIDSARYWDSTLNQDVYLGLFYQSTEELAEPPQSAAFEEYKKEGNTVEAILRFISGDEAATPESFKFTDAEAYALLETYFQRAVDNQEVYLYSDCQSNREQIATKYAHYDGDGKWCGVQVDDGTDLGQTYNIVADNYSELRSATLSEILEKMTNWSFEDGDQAVGGLTGDGSASEEENDDQNCFAQAGALGWIICPVIETLGNNMKEIYNWVEEDFLQTNTDIFSDSRYGVGSTWGLFRDLANYCLILAIIVVIVSQLTGVGVSNYGIKKSLPRIIVAAILINLSYLICELAIDLSNILGAGLKELFENLVDIDGRATAPGGVGAAYLVGALAALGVGAAIITLNPAVILTLLLFLLSGLIAVFFLWVLLVTRQAGLIIGVIIVPLAVVCYMLPNLQNTFKRYLKIMKAMLLLYPICGLVVGGGNFAAKVMVNIGVNMSDGAGTSFVLAGMALQVLPFFFIPMLLKGSMSALGNVGAKITGLGSRLSGKLSGGIKQFEGYKDLRRRGLERKLRLRAGLDRKGNVSKNPLTRAASIGFGRGRRRMAASAVLDKNASMGRFRDATFVAAQVARRDVAQETAEVQAMEDLIKSERLGTGEKLVDKPEEMGRRYEQALLNNDTIKIKAYQNLMSGREDTRNALHGAVKRAEPSASRSAMLTHASNLINHHSSEYKNNARSTFDHAASVAQGGHEPIHTFETSPRLISSLKSETLGGMDEPEFNYLTSIANSAPDGADAQSFYDACYDALNNETAMSNVKQSRKAALAHFAALSSKAQSGSETNAQSGSETDSGPVRVRKQGGLQLEPGEVMTEGGLIIKKDSWEKFKREQGRTGKSGQSGS